MDIASIVYTTMEAVTGLPEEELREMPDMDLQENELMDSLSTAELLSSVGLAIGKNIDLKKFKTEDFATINSIIAAIETHYGE